MSLWNVDLDVHRVSTSLYTFSVQRRKTNEYPKWKGESGKGILGYIEKYLRFPRPGIVSLIDGVECLATNVSFVCEIPNKRRPESG